MLEPRLKVGYELSRVSLLLRNLIVREVKYVDDPGIVFSRDYDWSRLADIYQQSLLDPLAAHMCGGHVITYLIALRAFGLVARKIGSIKRLSGRRTSPSVTRASRS